MTEFLVQKRGRGGGIATLDESGKIPVDQLSETVSKKHRMSVNLTSPGWYRIFTFPSIIEAQFTLSLIRSWGYVIGENFSVNIAMSQVVGTSNNGIYRVSFTQNNRVVSYNVLTGVRIVSDNFNYKPVHIDVQYVADHENVVLAQLDNFLLTAVGDMEITSNVEKDPEILETQHVYEWHPDKNGMVANCAIADGDGNNIADTYATKRSLESECLTVAEYPTTVTSTNQIRYNIPLGIATGDNFIDIKALKLHWQTLLGSAYNNLKFDLAGATFPIEVQTIGRPGDRSKLIITSPTRSASSLSTVLKYIEWMDVESLVSGITILLSVAILSLFKNLIIILSGNVIETSFDNCTIHLSGNAVSCSFTNCSIIGTMSDAAYNSCTFINCTGRIITETGEKVLN